MLVSIIIPVYNVESYIAECLRSVMRQTYRDIEVLLVDDCGSDLSIDIVHSLIGQADECVHKDVRFRILHHQHNHGLSAARNTGIGEARGEWIYYLDSDDWIADDCIERLIDAARQEAGIEMAIGQLETFDDKGRQGVMLQNGRHCPLLNLPDGVYGGDILQKYLSGGFYEMAWNKLVRRDFLIRHDLFFREGLIHEDTLWSFCCACQLQKIAVVNRTLYHYRIQPGSIMSQSAGARRMLALNTILSCQIDYAITHGLGDNRLVFDRLFPKIKGYFFNPDFRHNASLSLDLYTKLDAAHFWSYRQLWRQVHARRDFFPYLCRILPVRLGIKFYRWLGKKLWVDLSDRKPDSLIIKESVEPMDASEFVHSFALYDELRYKNILITGASGLIGRTLTRCLLLLDKTYGLNLCLHTPRHAELASWTEQCTAPIDYIIHLACPTASREMVQQPVEVCNAILDSTRLMLEFARKQEAVMVYASSMEVYGAILTDDEIAEDCQGYVDPMSVRSCYPMGKRMAETLCHCYAREFGTDVRIARLVQTFGAGISADDQRVFAQFARSVISGRDILLHTPGQSARKYLYLTDAVSALLYIMLRGQRGEAYNAARTDSYISILDLAQMVKREFAPHIDVRIEVQPDAPYPQETHLNVSTAKLESLGWEARIPLRTMFARLIESMPDC